MISSYGDQSATRIILHIIIVLHQHCLIAQNASRDTLCSIHLITTSVLIEMVLLSIFLRIRSTERIISRLFFIHFCRCSTLHLAVKILLQIFLWKIWALLYGTSVGCISLQNASRTALCYAILLLLSENILIFDINHQLYTKHKEVRPNWNNKTIMQTTRASYHMEGFTNGSGCHFKRNIRSSAKRFRLWIVLFWTKALQRLHIFI